MALADLTGKSVLFVSNTLPPLAGEQEYADRLTASGASVTIENDGPTIEATGANYDLIIVSASIASGNMAARLLNVAKPMIIAEAYILDDHLLGATPYNLTGQTQIEVVDSAHYIASGLTGTVSVYTSSRNVYGATGLSPGAHVVANSSDGRPCLVVWETGAERTDASFTPARRVALYMADQWDGSPQSAEGLILSDAAVNWSLGLEGAALVADLDPSPASITASTEDLAFGAYPAWPDLSGLTIPIIVNSPSSPFPGELALQAELEAHGATVSLIPPSGNVATEPADLLIVSASINSTLLGTAGASRPIPAVIAETFVWDDWQLASSPAVAEGEAVDIVDDTHPIAAGLTGHQVWYTQPRNLYRATGLAPGAQVIAEVGGTPAVIAYETGAELLDASLAPARRVALGINDEWGGVSTGSAMAMVAASVAWALDLTVEVSGAIPGKVSPEGPSTVESAVFAGSSSTVSVTPTGPSSVSAGTVQASSSPATVTPSGPGSIAAVPIGEAGRAGDISPTGPSSVSSGAVQASSSPSTVTPSGPSTIGAGYLGTGGTAGTVEASGPSGVSSGAVQASSSPATVTPSGPATIDAQPIGEAGAAGDISPTGPSAVHVEVVQASASGGGVSPTSGAVHTGAVQASSSPATVTPTGPSTIDADQVGGGAAIGARVRPIGGAVHVEVVQASASGGEVSPTSGAVHAGAVQASTSLASVTPIGAGSVSSGAVQASSSLASVTPIGPISIDDRPSTELFAGTVTPLEGVVHSTAVDTLTGGTGNVTPVAGVVVILEADYWQTVRPINLVISDEPVRLYG